MGSAITVRGLNKEFAHASGNGRFAVFRNLNLDISSGEVLAIVGPSGCGKTTLLNVLALLLPIDRGEVFIDGRSRSVKDAGTVSMGYLFQRDALLPWRTAWGNALLGLECRGRLTDEAKAVAAGYFDRFGLVGFEDAWPRTLSGGQRQRVALIQNLLLDPEILLLDEPFGSLDYQTKLVLEEELLSVIRPNGNKQRKTVVFVTHDIEEAIALADRVLVLGLRAAGIILDAPVSLPEGLRTPVAARQSEVMRDMFGKIWAKLRFEADDLHTPDEHEEKPFATVAAGRG